MSQPHKVGMMLKCSPGQLLARVAFMHHDDQGHDELRHDAVLKGLKLWEGGCEGGGVKGRRYY